MKNIQDYLHLYPGVQLVSKATNKKVGVLLGVVGNEAYFKERAGVVYSSSASNYKPLLRKISDMSEEESEFQSNAAWEGKSTILMNAEITAYLLSKYFDLFGLHEAGLCLYKTDLK